MTDQVVLRHPDIPQPYVIPLPPDGTISPEYELAGWTIDPGTHPDDAIAESVEHTEALRVEALDDPPVDPHFGTIPADGDDQPPVDSPPAEQAADPSIEQPPAEPKTLYRHVGDATFDAEAWPDSGLKNAAGDVLRTFVGDTERGDAKGASDEWVVDTAANPEPATDSSGETEKQDAPAEEQTPGEQQDPPDSSAAPSPEADASGSDSSAEDSSSTESVAAPSGRRRKP